MSNSIDFGLTEKVIDLTAAPTQAVVLTQFAVPSVVSESIPGVEIVRLNQRWEPSESDYKLIRDLAELGWPSVKVSEALNVTPKQFAGAMKRLPRLKQEYELGVENSNAFQERRLAWRPMPGDLQKVNELAQKGLGPVEIAAKLKVSRGAFLNRMNDTLQLKEAFEIGEGEYRARLLEDSQDLLDDGGPELKNASSLLIFKLKAHCGLADKGPSQVVVGGEIKHTHQLKAPSPVPINQLPDFAQAEMERARQISAQQLKQLEVDVIDVEATEVL